MKDAIVKLSRREQQCLYFAAQDLNLDETALKMNLSYDTVKTYRRFVMRKLNCKTMAGAISRAIELRVMW